jgi:hypothetical protein
MRLELDDPILIKLLEDEEETVESKNLRGWAKEHLVSQTRLLKNFGHVNVYNRLNYENGLLDKLESLRNNFTSHAISEIIDLLYIVGYSFKAMAYILYKYGYDGNTTRQIREYIKDNKYRLLEKRREFMNALATAKSEVFQEFAEQVKKGEGETVKLYMKKMIQIRAELENVDPIADTPKFKRLVNLLDQLQDRINECHGVTQMREAYVEVQKVNAIDDHKFELEIKRIDHTETLKLNGGGVGNGANKIIDMDSAFQLAGPEDSPSVSSTHARN